jgi:hypothetical protein
MKHDVLGFHNIKKQKFLDFYKRDDIKGNVSATCLAVTIDRKTYYNWLEKDAKFRKAIYDMKMKLCDDMEQVLIARAVEKDTTALIYWLKYNNPTYKEVGATTNLQVNVIPILGGQSVKTIGNVHTNNSNEKVIDAE